ncbi:MULTISPECIES: MarR family winged helix-turn-helix transcriptional regulator [unclassified Rathayibacter]|uniref:MarR family winged helix-turn-helix transcriptional regulator n=1 Tax=unclassified Rathayibacter TaxID=2609250 RepID=UPI001FB41255|nr:MULTISPECIES: MarR family transcriptional regulator [unclassified Rathayibacter]MCJ1675228.1 MarR family transcriptional regulator [Rathayibacter sp. VKM Ac-2929]MCJ1686989.1 MarR family transcriptional regulator [Rathayibacter sp. VKM Ac-2927]
MTGPDPAPLSGDDLAAWSALATVLEWLPATLDAQLLRDSGLSHFEYGVLYALATAPERTLRMSALAGFANSSLSRLSRAVSRLEARGWVERRPDPGDGRTTLATLTATGAAQQEQAAPGHETLVRAVVLDPLSARQRRELQAIAATIAGAIRPDGSWTAPPEDRAAR